MSAAFYVQDAMGDKFLFTIADADYEAQFRKHARWWTASGWKQSRANPVKPFSVVVEPKP